MGTRIFFVAILGPFLVAIYAIQSSTDGISLSYQPRVIPPDIQFWHSPYPTDHGSKDFSKEALQNDPELRLQTVRANELLKSIQQTSAKYSLHYVGPKIFQLTRAAWLDWPRLELTGNDLFNFTFCTTNNSFADYFNSGASKESRKSGKSKKPEWSMGKAVEVATAFLHAVTDTSYILLETPNVQFKGTPDNEVGEWEVSWKRADGAGYEFGEGRAVLNISETTGLMGAYVRLSDPYQTEPGPPMGQNDALKIAKRLHPSLGTESDEIRDYKVESAKLWVVEPGEIWGCPCRLAWVFQLKPVRSKPVNYMDDQIVEVDAHTGEILFIDAYL